MPEDNKLSDSDGAVLVKTARKAVTEFLGKSKTMHVTNAAGTDFYSEIGDYPSLCQYGFADGVWAGMPVRTISPGTYEVVESYKHDDFAKKALNC